MIWPVVGPFPSQVPSDYGLVGKVEPFKLAPLSLTSLGLSRRASASPSLGCCTLYLTMAGPLHTQPSKHGINASPCYNCIHSMASTLIVKSHACVLCLPHRRSCRPVPLRALMHSWTAWHRPTRTRSLPRAPRCPPATSSWSSCRPSAR